MFAGGSPRISSGPAGGGKGQGAKSNVNQTWQCSLRSASAAQAAIASSTPPRAASPGNTARSRSEDPANRVAPVQPEGDAQYPYPFPPPGIFNPAAHYDPYAGPHPAGYGTALPVEYDSFFAPHFSNEYPNGDFLYDRPVMYNDLPAYMPSYKDLMDRKARKEQTLGRELPETQGTRKEVAEAMVPPKRLATKGYKPAIDRGPQASYHIGGGWHGEKSAQDVANSHAHQNYYIPDRFERTKHRADWKDWTREEGNNKTYRIRRHGDEQYGDAHLHQGHHASRSPPGVRHVNRTSHSTVQQPRAHGNVISSTKPLLTL